MEYYGSAMAIKCGKKAYEILRNFFKDEGIEIEGYIPETLNYYVININRMNLHTKFGANSDDTVINRTKSLYSLLDMLKERSEKEGNGSKDDYGYSFMRIGDWDGDIESLSTGNRDYNIYLQRIMLFDESDDMKFKRID